MTVAAMLHDLSSGWGACSHSPMVGLLSDASANAAKVIDAAAKSDESLLSIGGVMTLGMLILLQAVLGFDNLLYISIESKRVEESKQSMVRRWGIGLAIGFRIALLFIVVKLIELLQEPFLNFVSKPLEMHVSGHALIVVGGVAF
ncbi:MAG: hypothetical protein AAGJ83_09285, partial [Planctomycetota bacterium]